MRLPAASGWGFSKDFPRPAQRTFRARFARLDHVDFQSRLKENQQVNDLVDSQVADSNNLQRADSPIQIFASELEALGGTFTRCQSENLAKSILTLLQERGIDQIMAWDDEQLPGGLLDSLREAGINIEHTPQPTIQVGLSGALGAVAHTGTLVLPSGRDRPQKVSLLPQIHVAVLNEETIYENLREVFTLPEVQNSSSVALISGPSRTADIEMTLTIGVHGPGELHVFSHKVS
jgi:L-lactate dehydrogenase complex protein LldG